MFKWRKILGLLILTSIFSCKKSITSNEESTYSLPERPNILWIVAEDLGPYIPSFGDSTVVTPNLSKLTDEGVRYTNLYSPSGVCAPSRAAIATGMYPSSIGANHMRTNQFMEVTGLPAYEAAPPPEVRMFSELLRAKGYYCTNNSKKDYQFKAPVTAWDESSNKAHWRNRKPEQPFFSIFNFGVTHESGLFEPYEREIVISKDIDFPIPPYLPNTETVKRDLWKMYNNIALLDQQIKKVLDELEEDGLLENTIIFFYTDHGGPLPRQKRMVYDSGLNSPMIIRFPNKMNAGQIDDQLISFVDFAPTILSLAGIDPPEILQGQSFLDNETRTHVFAAADRFDGFTDVKRAIRDTRFKYIRNYRPEQSYYLPVSYRERIPTMQELLSLRDSGELNEIQMQWFRENKPKEELFDCLNDPHEIKNLAENPEYAAKLFELRNAMDQWVEVIDDKPNLPESELIQQLWLNQKEQPVTAPPLINTENDLLNITCETEGASIGYRVSIDSTSLKSTWNVYTAPFKLKEGTAIEVQAHRIGYKPSEIVQHKGIK